MKNLASNKETKEWNNLYSLTNGMFSTVYFFAANLSPGFVDEMLEI